MTSIIQLRNKAVTYAIQQIRAEVDYQEIGWNILNLEEFNDLVSHPDIEDLDDYINAIIADAELTVEEELEENQRRWQQYQDEYPELERPWWEREV